MRGVRPQRFPIWFMRQAGRSLPEYRAAREGHSMLDSCLVPELAAEITLQPVRRHHVDAAVFFSDIMVPLKLAGVDVDIAPGIGPVVADPVRTAADVERLTSRELGDASAIREAVALVVQELSSTPSGDAGWTPVIGFAGAPFTVAAYLVEGRPSRDHLAARAMMHAEPDAWAALLAWVADLSGEFMRAQVEAGASAVQLFDSWAGSLSPDAYGRHVAPWSARAFGHVADLDVPGVHFGTGTAELLPQLADVVASVMTHAVQGVDDRIDLAMAIERINRDRERPLPVQGNIDPAMLAVGWDTLQTHIDHVLEAGRAAPGHVVNLGHGVPPTTDPGVLTAIVEYVHAAS